MTEQKKKAEDIYRKLEKDFYDNSFCDADVSVDEMVKKMSLTLIDEILKEIYSNKVITNDKRRIFWQQVKEDIINYKN